MVPETEKKILGMALGLGIMLTMVSLVSGAKISPEKSGIRGDIAIGLILHGTVVTMDSDLTVIDDGIVIVNGSKIVYVGENNTTPPNYSNALELYTEGYIFPALMNIHDHLSYNFIPLWQVPAKFSNRYQWQNHPFYKVNITNPKNLLTGSSYLNMVAEVSKWAEIKHIAGGAASVEGSENLNAITKILARNIEHYNFGQDRVRTRVSSVTSMTQSEIDSVRSDMENGTIDAWIVHLAEGIDATSQNEFNFIKSVGLLTNTTRIVHGIALSQQNFTEMAAVGAWIYHSPVSNLLLYGTTTNVSLAKQCGVNLVLTTDWSPSGGKNILLEMKYLYEYADEYWPGVFTPIEIVKMVTRNPAISIGWDNFVGHLAQGLYADIAVFAKLESDPYLSLLKSTEKDVKLVLINGEAIYGEVAYMELLKPGDYEVITSPCGLQKAIDVTNTSAPLGNETFAQLSYWLTEAAKLNKTFLKEHMNNETVQNMTDAEFDLWLSSKFPDGITPYVLDPIFTCDDRYFFDTMRNSTIANLTFDVEQIYYAFHHQPYAPDLEISQADVSISPEYPPAGKNTTINVSVRNTGDYWASKVRVELYADNQLVGKSFVNFLNAGETKTVRFDVYFQNSPNKIKVVLDGKNKVPEKIETNNVVEITLVYPDIVLESAAALPSSPVEGDNVTITGVLKNIGNGTVSGLQVFLIVDGVKVGETIIGTLAPGENKTVTFYWIATFGQHTICVYADPGNTVGELNETNNAYEFQINVTQPVNEHPAMGFIFLASAISLLLRRKSRGKLG
ncbi:MAG: CARDB domain-containing protein [Thermoplasmata archaeon]